MAQYEAGITTGVAQETTPANSALWQYGKKFFFMNLEGNMRHVGCDADTPLSFRMARVVFAPRLPMREGKEERIEW